MYYSIKSLSNEWFVPYNREFNKLMLYDYKMYIRNLCSNIRVDQVQGNSLNDL